MARFALALRRACRRKRPLPTGFLVPSLALAGAAGMVWLGFLGGCSKAPPAPVLENLVLISIDTLRPDRLGLHGYERPVSPHLDAIGDAGVVFEEAISQAPWTAPSHASMLTSLYPSVLHIGRFSSPGKVSPAAETLAETLGKRGFATCAVTGGGFVSRELGFDQGFDLFLTRRSTREAVELALERCVPARDPGRPFFLFLHTYEVHRYAPREPFRSEFVRPYEGPLTEVEEIAELLQKFENRPRVRELAADDWRYVNDLYDACIASVDAAIGVLVNRLEKRGLLQETLVVVTSDHGEELGERGQSGHGYTLYDENLRVPLFLYHGSLSPARVDSQVRVLDIAPTVLDMLGIEIPEAYQGMSLVPLLNGRRESRVAYSEEAHIALKSIRIGGFKYVIGATGASRELYDLGADPTELRNLTAGSIGEREASMRQEMTRWIEENVERRMMRGEEAAGMSEQMRSELEALGYLGDSGGTPVVEAEAWLELLRGD